MPGDALRLLVPEVILVAAAVLIYVSGAFVNARALWGWTALAALAAAAVTLLGTSTSPGDTGPVAADHLALYTRWLTLAAGAVLTLVAMRPLEPAGHPEHVGSLLLAIAGTMLVAAADELVLMFLGLELISIPTYIMLYLGRREATSQEAAAKYFFLSILSSAMLLYGFSFLYGAAGTTDLEAVRQRLADGQDSTAAVYLARVALVFVFAGLGFRITAVPFHFYAPDVYQGTTHANAGFLSVLPKVAGVLALVRIVAIAMEDIGPYPWRVAAALAVVTMTLGNVVALWQNNIRRLLAYSSIAHAGYILIGLAVYLASPTANQFFDGVAAVLLYLLVYAVATLGAFSALSCLGRGDRQVDSIDELAGLAWSGGAVRPALAWALAIFMFSLAGLPPLAGFWGKLAIFGSALMVRTVRDGVPLWFWMLALIGVLNAAVSAAYYLRVIGTMFFRPSSDAPARPAETGGALVATVLCAILAVGIGLSGWNWFPLADRASPRQVRATPATATAAPMADIGPLVAAEGPH